MNLRMLGLVAALGLPALSANAARDTPLPAERCLPTRWPMEWVAPDARTVLARAGHRPVRIVLATSCESLAFARPLGFKTVIGDRLCGHRGEAVLSEGTVCYVQRVEAISDQEFDALIGLRPVVAGGH